MSTATLDTVEPVARPFGNNHEKLGWSIKDEPGEFRWIDKSLLMIDPSYQRKFIRHDVVRGIRREWSWAACLVLAVARRPDGTLWVYDGQHRKLAADELPFIHTLPCMIFEFDDVQDEAKTFLEINSRRGSMKSSDKFSAQLRAGDDDARFVNQMVEQSGYRIVRTATSPKTVACVATLLKCVRSNRGLCSRVWQLCVELYQDKPAQQELVEGLFTLETRLQNKKVGQSIFDTHNRKALIAAGVTELYENINRAKAYHRRGGEKTYARGILDTLNYRRTTRKIDPAILDCE